MAYDGIFIKSQINEIKKIILNEHIAKITQSTNKDINIQIRKNGKNLFLTLSSNPNFPHILLSETEKYNLPVPPSFCMLLRKYLQSGTIKNIKQINSKILKQSANPQLNNLSTLERIVDFEIENIDENGDINIYHLFIEIMGKYSNIIITNSNLYILDVLIKNNITEDPRLKQKNIYNIEKICDKKEFLEENQNDFIKTIYTYYSLCKINNEKFDFANAICKYYAGLSKNTINHIIKLSNLNISKLEDFIVKNEITNFEFSNDNSILINLFSNIYNYIKQLIDNPNIFSPTIHYKNNKPTDFYIIKLSQYEGETKVFNKINICLETYINEKYIELNDSSEKKNIEEIIKNLYIKLNKKLDIYKKDIDKCDNLEMYKLYGDLVSAYGYNKSLIKNNTLTCEDYNNNNKIISIPLKPDLSISENVKYYYDKYNKLKRTKEKTLELLNATEKKIEHLNSIFSSTQFSNDKNDIRLIKEELIKYFDETNKILSLNNIKKLSKEKNNNRKQNSKNNFNYNIHHYKSSNGIDIYVGKNNIQNEYLTFTIAEPYDTWLHIKNATGSHVIIKKPYEKLDDKTLIEAASLAAYFSDKKNETKTTVDYTLRKELKKVKGKAPGFCIYHKNYSINVKPELILKEC